MTLVVAGVRLDQVDGGELILGVSLDVGYLKVEPLGVSGGVVVVLEDQVIAVGLFKFDNTA